MDMRHSLIPFMLMAGAMMYPVQSTRSNPQGQPPKSKYPENWMKGCLNPGCMQKRRGNKSYCSLECCEEHKQIKKDEQSCSYK